MVEMRELSSPCEPSDKVVVLCRGADRLLCISGQQVGDIVLYHVG